MQSMPFDVDPGHESWLGLNFYHMSTIDRYVILGSLENNPGVVLAAQVTLTLLHS